MYPPLFSVNIEELPVDNMTEEERKTALSIRNVSLRGN